MKKINMLVAAAGLGVLLAGCQNGNCTCCRAWEHPDSSAWEDLFDKTLSNAEFPAGGWRYAADGWLESTQGEPIFTKKDYGSAVIDMVYVVSPGANSGVFLYDSDHAKKKKFEVQIIDDRSSVFGELKPYQYTGAVYGRCAPCAMLSHPAGEENRMTVWCEGGHIRVCLNGQKVVDLEMNDYVDPLVNPDGTKIPSYMVGTPALGTIPRHGKIGLQGVHNTTFPVRFKYVKIREMK